MGKDYAPDRGDIVWVDLAPTVGHEQSGSRPALVVSSLAFNTRTGLALLAPITSKEKGYAMDVFIDNDKIKGYIMPYKARFIDWRARGVRYACRSTASQTATVVDYLSLIIKE